MYRDLWIDGAHMRHEVLLVDRPNNAKRAECAHTVPVASGTDRRLAAAVSGLRWDHRRGEALLPASEAVSLSASPRLEGGAGALDGRYADGGSSAAQ